MAQDKIFFFFLQTQVKNITSYSRPYRSFPPDQHDREKNHTVCYNSIPSEIQSSSKNRNIQVNNYNIKQSKKKTTQKRVRISYMSVLNASLHIDNIADN